MGDRIGRVEKATKKIVVEVRGRCVLLDRDADADADTGAALRPTNCMTATEQPAAAHVLVRATP